MDAVGVGSRVGQLLRREWGPLLLVDGSVGVFPVVGQLGYVEERHRIFGFPKLLSDHPHYASPAVGTPVRRVVDRRRLVVAVPPGLASPVTAPV
ncbi:unnamed protein product [Linum trigynum]|uniref:Uncharacterized protein n=1 Tax=Linum trigynum TaxID=586398 RepID=A0AAV2EP34_9ROSI